MRVRTAIAEPGPDPRPAGRIPDDMDRLAASLHGRRSRVAEAEHLTDLCRVRTLPELAQTVFPGSEPEGVLGFQRLAVHRLARELSGLVAYLSGPPARLLHWALVRFQIEDLKVLIRTRLSKSPQSDGHEYLVPLPKEVALDAQGLSAAESLDDFVRLAPKGLLRESLRRTIEIYGDHPRPFFFEAVLDHDYFQGLLANVEGLPWEDREVVKPMFRQEVDIFHLMLVVRGKFHYGLTLEALLPLHVPGARVTRAVFAEMLHDQDIRTSAGRATEFVFDVLPFEGGPNHPSPAVAVDAAGIERLAWTRFARLANLAFRQGHVGLGAVVGYAGIRRVEVANLVTLSEGIRKGMPAEAIRARMITYRGGEAFHV